MLAFVPLSPRIEELVSGDAVCLIGSGDVLGQWDVKNAVTLQTGPELFPRHEEMCNLERE